MPDSVCCITKTRGKEKKISRKKRHSNEERNDGEENTGLSDEEVICIALICVLATSSSPKHNLNVLDFFFSTTI